MEQVLSDFKELKIGVNELKKAIGNDLYNISDVKPIKIVAEDVINAIKKFSQHDISTDKFVDWVNVVWFTDLYYYNPLQEDPIASVMSLLETLDEENMSFSKVELNRMILSLENNIECKLI